MNLPSSPILIRPCRGMEELAACVELQIDVWGYGDRDVVPRRVFIVSQKIGGQVIGAFDTAQPNADPEGGPGSMVGFAMSLPGISGGRPYLHSHMLAVNPDYRNQGIGRRLKLFQREEALARGISRMEWTFDPLEIKNSFLNIAKLGAVVRRYAPNFYGVTSSRLHGQVPTDRLYAEWWLESDWVCSTLRGKPLALPAIEQEIPVPHQIAHWRHSPSDQERVLETQSRNREQFEQAFALRLAVIGFRIDTEGNGIFQLGRWAGTIPWFLTFTPTGIGQVFMKIESIVLRELGMTLVHPFATSFGETRERRVLLAEVRAEGLSGWGECTTGEHPYFSEESTDTAWVTILQELGPLLAAAEDQSGGKCPEIFRRVRGHRMAKAALENALWDLEAQMRRISLSELLGGTRETIACGVSIGIQPSLEKLMEKVATAVSQGYQRIKLKCKPGWDLEMFEAVRNRWPEIVLSCDANSAYRLRDADHLVSFDQFNLLMIEQPLWADDFYFHAMLQQRLDTAICLDESIRNRRDSLAAIEMESCRIINIKLGRVGGFSEAIAIHNLTLERGIPVWCGGMLESGVGRSHNIAVSTLENYSLPGDVSASSRYWADDIIEPEVTVSPAGEIRVPTTPGRGFEIRADLVERLTVRKEEIKTMALVS